METPISVLAYAKLLQVDEKAVRKAIADGKIKKGYNKTKKKIIPSKADDEWGNVHKVPRPQRGVSKLKAAGKLEKQLSANGEVGLSALNKIGQEESFDYNELIDGIKLNPNLPYSEALRRKEILSIAHQRMQLELQQGILVKKADVDKALFAIGDMMKKALLNIPYRCIDDILAAANKIDAATILTMEIQSVLNHFAQHIELTGS
ncbi:MAG: hypothetical protein ACJ75B_20850 [Flavisolibacter sp.]